MTASTSGINAIAHELVLKNPPLPLIGSATNAPPLIGAIEHNLTLRQSRNDLWLPNLAHKDISTILVCSDYGGESHDAAFNTYSFLFAGYQLLAPVLSKFGEIRARHRLNSPFSEVCFKKFRHAPIGRCIPEWLHAADAVSGLLFTLVIPKTVYSVFGKNDRATLKSLSDLMASEGFPNWKGETAEKLLRIVHVVGYFLGLLTREGQEVVWMSDDDSILANDERTEHVKHILAHRLSQYGHGKYGTVALAKPFAKAKDTYSVSEFLSLPDMAAGSIQSMLAEEPRGADARIRLQANSVLLWLAHQGVFLKKMTTHVRTNESGAIEVGSTEFIPTVPQTIRTVVLGDDQQSSRLLTKMRVKIALSHKYRRLSRTASSKAKRRQFASKSKRYDRQATQILWHGDGGKR